MKEKGVKFQKQAQAAQKKRKEEQRQTTPFSAEARLESQIEEYKKTLKELEKFYSDNPEYLEFEQY